MKQFEMKLNNNNILSCLLWSICILWKNQWMSITCCSRSRIWRIWYSSESTSYISKLCYSHRDKVIRNCWQIGNHFNFEVGKTVLFFQFGMIYLITWQCFQLVLDFRLTTSLLISRGRHGISESADALTQGYVLCKK